MASLPYAGYTWTLTQHEGKINARDLYGLLAAATFAQGSARPGQAANRYLVDLSSKGLVSLTRNVREQIESPWRDYQQVLPELGLMRSTRTDRSLSLTPMGELFFDRVIGFGELITTQALRLQYPNGQKQARLAKDVASGVLLRPAVLILRLLVELFERGAERAELTARDVERAILPAKRNSDWPEALARLSTVGGSHQHARRNVQDWLKLLAKTDLFQTTSTRGAIRLTRLAEENTSHLRNILTRLEDPGTFWLPSAGGDAAASWFRFYGSPATVDLWHPALESMPVDYIKDNYVGPPPSEDPEPRSNRQISLEDFGSFVPNVRRIPHELKIDVERLLAGQAAQARGTTLHDRIVLELGQRLNALAFRVRFDPDSIDLEARRGADHALFEIKTIGPLNTTARLRLGTGQLIEYRRRYESQFDATPNCVLVVNGGDLPSAVSHWPDVLEKGADMGLLTYHDGVFRALTGGPIERSVASF